MFTSNRDKPRRRWWQWLVRLAAIAVLAGAGAYVSLPYWLPAESIKEHLADQMSQQMGVDVAIGDMSFSWSNGVELTHLEISDPRDPTPTPMIQVQSVRAEFSPLTYFLQNKIGWMELDRPKVFVVVDDTGQINLAVLQRLRFDAVADRISVRQAGATIKLPDHERLLRLRVHNAEYVAGRLKELGRVTVSATLDQQDSLAPLSMRMAAGAGERIPATALFNFAELNLGQLPLAKLLGLPLAKLGGRCRGSLDLQLNRYGVVDQFALNVSVAELEVQPSDSPKLPIIPEAGFSVSAVFDPIAGDLEAGLLEIRSAHVRLPGLDVAGHASVSTDILTGRWEAIGDLEVEGNVSPDTLATFFLGRSQLPGPLQANGPISFRVSARRDRTILYANGFVRADLAEIYWADDLVKPADRPLQLTFDGSLDRRTWRLRLDKDASSLLIGKNRFAGGGTIADLRRLVRPLPTDSLPEAVAALPERLRLLDWDGDFHILELESLSFVTDRLADATGPIKLHGELAGELSVRQPGDIALSLSVHARPGTALSVGDLLSAELESGHADASARMPMLLECSAIASEEEQFVEMLQLTLSAGGSQVNIDNGTLQLARDDSSGHRELVAEGNFTATELDALSRFVPALQLEQPNRLEGSVTGQYTLLIGEGRQHASLTADWKQAGVQLTGILSKEPGLEAELALDLIRSRNGTSPWRQDARVTGSIPGAGLILSAATPGSDRPEIASSWKLQAHVTDAGKLAPVVPRIAALFSQGRLAGTAEITGTGTWRKGRVDGNLAIDASPLALSTGGKGPRTKAALVPLTVSLAGGLVANETETLLQIDDAFLRLGDTQARLAGSAKIHRCPEAAATKRPLSRSFSHLNLAVAATTHIDDALVAFLPEVAGLCDRYGLAGTVTGESNLALRRGQLAVSSHFDIGRLSIRQIGPLPLPPDWNDHKNYRQLAKPADMPGVIDFELTASEDLHWVRLNNLRLQLADATVLADGFAEFDAEAVPGSFAKGPRKAIAHLAISIPRAEILSSIAPWLESYGPAGDAYAELAVSASYGKGLVVNSAKLKADTLSASATAKQITLAGEVSAEGMHIGPGDEFSLGSFETSGLDVRLGQSRFWLAASLENLDEAPAGSFQVVAPTLDFSELSAWFTGRTDRDDTEAHNNRSGVQAFRLSDEERDRLAKEAEQLVQRLKQFLSGAEITGRLTGGHLKTYDPSVQQYYDIDQLQLSLNVSQGNITCNYVAGLNGGTIRNSYTVRIDDPEPVVTYEPQMRNVIATESIQPQLARYFPGNAVGGLFTRTERSKAPLRNLVANMKDYRFHLQHSGEARTVTTDGLVEGRAAPRFVTRIFPGLNLAKYKYDKMTAFATFRPDGVAQNDMVFSGPIYDVYIQGETDANNIGQYQIGLILLGSPQSPEWNHTYKQGRIPILKLKARIEGGKMHDEEVSYPWPSESLFVIFLQNNIFYRIWLAAANK